MRDVENQGICKSSNTAKNVLTCVTLQLSGATFCIQIKDLRKCTTILSAYTKNMLLG